MSVVEGRTVAGRSAVVKEKQVHQLTDTVAGKLGSASGRVWTPMPNHPPQHVGVAVPLAVPASDVSHV